MIARVKLLIPWICFSLLMFIAIMFIAANIDRMSLSEWISRNVLLFIIYLFSCIGTTLLVKKTSFYLKCKFSMQNYNLIYVTHMVLGELTTMLSALICIILLVFSLVGDRTTVAFICLILATSFLPAKRIIYTTNSGDNIYYYYDDILLNPKIIKKM
jgi:hypothetical protein